MSKITWDNTGERYYETGVKNGVLYPQDSNGLYPLGVAWNGLTAVTESPSGAESTPIYADDIKYLNLVSAEEFAATIEAYTYPDEFEACDGTGELTPGAVVGQQNRQNFGFAYKTTLGNDVEGNSYGYKLHLVYGATAAPSEKGYQTINDSPEAIAFSWEVNTTPVAVTGLKPTASISIDSTKVDATKLAALELVLYGDDGVDPRLPLPDEVKSILTVTPAAVALSSSAPADEDSDVAIDTTVILTFNNAIVQEAISMFSAAGTPVAFTSEWDSTMKVMTITPDSNLTNSTTYIVSVHGVVDMYGQTLATEGINFSTIA